MPILPRCDQESNQKRNLGFVKLRRGLREHLPTMSGNAVKLYLWLQFATHWSGPKRGWVETDFEYMARGNGWSPKTLQRAIKELEARPYIKVERATSQYESTRIKILKYEQEETDATVHTDEPSSNSAVDKSDHTSHGGVARGEDRRVDELDRTSDHTSPPINQSEKDLPGPKKSKEVKKEKNGCADAVRRPFDAERLRATKPFSLKEKKQKLNNNLAAKILENDDLYSEFVAYERKRGRPHPFGKEEQEAFAAIRYKPDLASPVMGFDFVMGVVHVYDETRDKNISPGNLCSKIIDYCDVERNKCGGSYYYPPDFVEHRNRLRAQERAQEKPRSASVSATKESRQVEAIPKRSAGEERAARTARALEVLDHPERLPEHLRPTGPTVPRRIRSSIPGCV